MEQQHDQMVRAALEALGLPELQVVADAEGIAALERRPGSTLRFAEALRRGVEAFLGDTLDSPGQGHDSAHHVVQADPESYGLGPDPSDTGVQVCRRRPKGLGTKIAAPATSKSARMDSGGAKISATPALGASKIRTAAIGPPPRP